MRVENPVWIGDWSVQKSLDSLSHDELIAKLHSLTNIRVVRDEESATGWKLVVGPFPGWETVPTW